MKRSAARAVAAAFSSPFALHLPGDRVGLEVERVLDLGPRARLARTTTKTTWTTTKTTAQGDHDRQGDAGLDAPGAQALEGRDHDGAGSSR